MNVCARTCAVPRMVCSSRFALRAAAALRGHTATSPPPAANRGLHLHRRRHRRLRRRIVNYIFIEYSSSWHRVRTLYAWSRYHARSLRAGIASNPLGGSVPPPLRASVTAKLIVSLPARVWRAPEASNRSEFSSELQRASESAPTPLRGCVRDLRAAPARSWTPREFRASVRAIKAATWPNRACGDHASTTSMTSR